MVSIYRKKKINKRSRIRIAYIDKSIDSINHSGVGHAHAVEQWMHNYT